MGSPCWRYSGATSAASVPGVPITAAPGKKQKTCLYESRWLKMYAGMSRVQNSFWWCYFFKPTSLSLYSPWYNHTGWQGIKHPFTYLLTLSLCPSSSLLFQAYNIVCFKNTSKFKQPSIIKISPLMFYLLLSVRWMQTGISFFVVIHQTKRSY